MNSEIVSVVIPVYNPDTIFLKQAIDSVCAQPYRPIELILSDDSEKTLPDLKELINRCNKEIPTTYIHNKRGRGIFSNLNNAIQHANGKFIQIFSQDDILNNGFIQEQINSFASGKDIGMVFSAFEQIDSNNKIVFANYKHLFDPGHSLMLTEEMATDLFIRTGCFVGNISPVMIRKEVFSRIGYFNEDLKYAGDFEFWVRLSASYLIFYNHLVGLKIRTHNQRASFTLPNNQLLKDLKYVYEILLERIPEMKRQQALSLINKRVGTSFLHYAIRETINLRWSLSNLLKRIKDLNTYPFNAKDSIRHYLISIPRRLIRKARLY